MATLVSPGTSVTVIDESFYTSAGPGTIPLIIIATVENKLSSSGTSVAAGTTKANADTLYLVSNQSDLLNTFGDPVFYSAAGSQLNGYSLNEYGLLAAYSYLGISNSAYILRADVDLAQLYPSTTAPAIDPPDGTYWMNTATSTPALYEWNSSTSKWVKQAVYSLPFNDQNNFYGTGLNDLQPKNVPSNYKYVLLSGQADLFNGALKTIGNVVMYRDTDGYFKYVVDAAILNTPISGTRDFQYSDVYPSKRFDGVSALQNKDIWFNTKENDYDLKVFRGSVDRYVDVTIPLNLNDAEALDHFGGINNIKKGDIYGMTGTQFVASITNNSSAGISAVLLRSWMGEIPSRTGNVTGASLTGTATIGVTTPGNDVPSTVITVNCSNTSIDELAALINATSGALQYGISASVTDGGYLKIDSLQGRDVYMSNTVFGAAGMSPVSWFFSNPITGFEYLSYESGPTPPVQTSADGTLWYNTDFKVDMLVNDGAGHWTEITQVIYLQPDEPTSPSDGQYWIDTNDLENYPVIRKRVSGEWVLRDNTDQVTPNGVVFADARAQFDDYGTNTGINNGGGTHSDLDADRPDPLLYPSGMVLFNTRYSTRVVKKYIKDYSFEGTLIGDRWVTISGNKPNGSPYVGDEAVRQVIAVAMRKSVNDNPALRSSDVFFNLIAAPGFPEMMSSMTTLNMDRAETGFVIGDSPFTLKNDANSLQQWCTNANNALVDGPDGLLTADHNLAVYYPSAVTTNVDGTVVVVPPSHAVLRTYAYNDQVAYQWYAPAGLQRGVISNASTVGYVDSVTGEFVPVILDDGQRDVLYSNNVNPIRQIKNKGAVIWGQKTRSPVQSAMDRVNVARLINYIRYQAELISQPFLFQPNDATTRKEVKAAYDSFLNELITLRGLDDFLVVCDGSNNTPARIDANELWVDIAVIPTKAVEFIYIPIRIKNHGSL